jgi:hypothetical protein
MNLYEFNILNETDKYKELLMHGVRIGELVNPDYCVWLYQIDTFYIELYYHGTNKKLIKLIAFSSIDNLSDYLSQIDLRNLFQVK